MLAGTRAMVLEALSGLGAVCAVPRAFVATKACQLLTPMPTSNDAAIAAPAAKASLLRRMWSIAR